MGIVEIITAAFGIIGTLVAWFFNPKRILYAQIDQTYKELEEAYVRRDKALAANDSDALTLVNADLIKLFTRKAVLLQRL